VYCVSLQAGSAEDAAVGDVVRACSVAV
jgi:hypothetical protein